MATPDINTSGLPPHLAANAAALASQQATLHTVQAVHQHNEQLKGELAKAVRIAQELQQQNSVLQSAWAKLKSESDELRDSYTLVRSQAEAALAAKQSAESECEKLYGVWQEKLEAKQAEFELIQQSMVPARELDLIRLQIMQEAQVAHAAHTDELKAEIAKYRTLYHDTHHSLVLLTNDANLKTASYEKDVAELRARSERTLAELANKNRKLQELVQDTTLADRAKALERANNELMVRNKALMQEVADTAKAAQSAAVAHEQAKLTAASAVAERDATVQQAQKEGELSQQTIHALSKDLAVAVALQQSLREEALQLAKLNEHQNTQHEITVTDLTFQKEELEKRLKEHERKEADVVTKTREMMDSANDRLVSLERRLADAQQKSEFDAREHAAQMKALREEHACTIRDHEHQELLLQEAKTHLQQNLLALELAKNEEIATLKQRFLTLQSELAVLHSERETYDARATEQKAEVEGVRKEMDDKVREHHELNLEYEQLQSKYRALGEKEHALEAAYDKLALETDSVKQELAAAAAALENERAHFLRDVTQLKSTARNEKHLMLQRLEEVSRAAQVQEEKRTAELTDAKREKAKYKKVSLALKAKMGEILREYAQAKRDHALAADAHRFALENLQKEKEDAERQRDEYKLRFGAVFPQPMLATAALPTTNTMNLMHIHAHLDPNAGAGASTIAGHASSSPVGLIDADAGARAVQQQLASMRSRAAE